MLVTNNIQIIEQYISNPEIFGVSLSLDQAQLDGDERLGVDKAGGAPGGVGLGRGPGPGGPQPRAPVRAPVRAPARAEHAAAVPVETRTRHPAWSRTRAVCF